MQLSPKCEQFIKERQYLANVSTRTIDWYRCSLQWLPNAEPTQQELNDMVVRMREKGNSPAGVNCVLRCVNAYLKWSGSLCKLPKLKEPSKVPEVFTEASVRRLVTWKPHTCSQRRLHVLVLVLLDTGCRISEALGLRVEHCDLDNLLVTLDGKGSKQRIVPMSMELRKAIFRRIASETLQPGDLLFGTAHGGLMLRRNVLRDVKTLCKTLGFDPPARTCHAFRHSFACNYVRQGGSVFHLQKTLGHTSLEMSRRYANLMTADLSAVHERFSMLNAR